MALTHREVRDVLQVHVPSRAQPDLRFHARGDFETWEVGGRYILRFASSDEGDAKLRREAAALTVLSQHLPVEVPHIDLVTTSAIGHVSSATPSSMESPARRTALLGSSRASSGTSLLGASRCSTGCGSTRSPPIYPTYHPSTTRRVYAR